MIKLDNLFPGWVRAQRMTFAAWLLQNELGTALPPQFEAYLEASFDQLLKQKNGFHNLPYLTLKLLQSLPFTLLDRYNDPALQEALKGPGPNLDGGQIGSAIAALSLARERPLRPSFGRAARLVADGLMSDVAHARGLASLGTTNFDKSWRACRSWLLRGRIRDALPVLHAPNDTEEKIRALSKICGGWPGLRRMTGGHNVEWFALNSVFLWPLSIHPFGPEDTIGFSVPLAIDVKYQREFQNKVEPTGHPYCDAGQIVRSLTDALNAAKDLWKSQKGNATPEHKDRILNAGLTVDTSYAGQIAAPFETKLRLQGPSLQAYMTIAILGRFIGIANHPPVAATGAIGGRTDTYLDNEPAGYEPSSVDSTNPAERTRSLASRIFRGQRDPADQLALDRYIDSVDGILEKLRWTHRSGQFDRVVLPASAHPDTHTNAGDTPEDAKKKAALQTYIDSGEATGEIIFAPTLSIMADTMLSGQWRRQRYIRTLDVASLYQSKQHLRLLDPQSGDLKPLLKLLRENKARIRRLDDEVTLPNLIMALRYLNEVWQPAQPMRRLYGKPAKRSILFFRMIPEEARARFLSPFCHAIGAPDAFFRELANSTSLEEVHQHLSRALNMWNPTTDAIGQIAPDVVVFILPAGEGPKGRSKLDFRNHLEFDVLFSDALAKQLKPIADDRWKKMLGQTRILIVQDAPTEAYLPSPARQPNRSDTQRLRQLSIFRHGFNQNMASRVLDPAVPPQELHKWLKNCAGEGFLCRVFGRYFIAEDQRQSLLANIDHFERAKLHMRAAFACAPYIDPESHSGLVEFEARFPEFVHEAQYHLDSVKEQEALGKRGGARQWNEELDGLDARRDYYIAQLSCAYESKNWDLPSFAIANAQFPRGNIPDGMRIALELAEDRGIRTLQSREACSTLGLIDMHLLDVAKGAASATKAELSELKSRAKALAGRAYRLAFEHSQSGHIDLAVFTAAHVAVVAMRPKGLRLFFRSSRIDDLNKLVYNALIENEKKPPSERSEQIGFSPPPEWYARFGETFKDNQRAEAFAMYKMGIEHQRRRIQRDIQLYINALGVTNPNSAEERWVYNEIEALRRDSSHRFDVFHRSVLSAMHESDHWKSGIAKYKARYEARAA